MEPKGSFAYILIDFDNFFDIYNDIERLTNEVDFICRELFTKIGDIDPINYISLRLYGGWFKNSFLTQRGSEVSSIIRQIQNIFPIVKNRKIIRGEIELAVSLIYFPEHQLDNTLKEKKGLPKARIAKNLDLTICEANKPNCPVKILNRFTSNKSCQITGCAHTNTTAFSAPQQKMVDTLITADIISISLKEETNSIYIFSEDIDCVPGILLASKINKERQSKINLVVSYQRKGAFNQFLEIFNTNNIQLIQWI